ncbi:MAG: hypothetical protein WCS65_17405 [Verrucomicrobiae bacterium]
MTDLDKLKIRTPGIISTTSWNTLVDAVKSSMVTAFSGGAFARTGGGTSLWTRATSGSGGSATVQPFTLLVGDDGATPTPSPMIRVIPSTLAGGSSTDLGFSEGDDPQYLLTPAEGILQGGITIDGTTGAVTSRWLEISATLTADDATTYYVEIGTVHYNTTSELWQATNSRYGPITATVCRDWYASAAPFFGVSFA